MLSRNSARGLVTRIRDARDRRAFLIQATAAGRSAKDEAIGVLDRQQAAFREPHAGMPKRLDDRVPQPTGEHQGVRIRRCQVRTHRVMTTFPAA